MMLPALLLWCVTAALAADPRVAVVQQRQVVDTLAAEVATARSEGADRDTMAELLARYRAAAEQLAALEAPEIVATAGAEAGARSAARRGLADALANGVAGERDRARLVAWRGEPADRLPALEAALEAARTAPDLGVRVGLAVDIADQADVLQLVAAYDAARAERDRERATSQAVVLRARTAPGQAGSLDLVVAAERLEREAAASGEQATAARDWQRRADELRAAAIAVAREEP